MTWTTKNRARGPGHPMWKGGRKTVGGYWLLLRPNHPNTTASGYVREHILVAEQALGKFLPSGAQVHHVNGDKKDNRSNNLVICPDQAYHTLLHMRTRAYDACGDPRAHRCHVCGTHDNQAGMRPIRQAGKSDLWRHPACHTNRERFRRESR